MFGKDYHHPPRTTHQVFGVSVSGQKTKEGEDHGSSEKIRVRVSVRVSSVKYCGHLSSFVSVTPEGSQETYPGNETVRNPVPSRYSRLRPPLSVIQR